MTLSKLVKGSIFLTAIALAAGCGTNVETAKEEWILGGFETPESAYYDVTRDIIYVSNVKGDAAEKDGNGYISRVSTNGKMKETHWITGLDAPKGIVSDGNTLYVADIDRLIAVDIEEGKISRVWHAEGAVFLNDTAIDTSGHIYVSDTVGGRIYVLKNDELGILAEGPELQHPNGLNTIEDLLLVAPWGAGMREDWSTESMGYLYTINVVSGEIEPFGVEGLSIGNLDGLEPDGNGNWIVSDWVGGNIYRISDSGSPELLFDLSQGTADLEFIVGRSLLVLPMMLDNTLVAYKIE